MPDLGLQVEVVIDQLHLEVSIVGNEGIVARHAVVQVGYTLLQLLHLPLHHIMPTQNTMSVCEQIGMLCLFQKKRSR